MFNGRKPEKNSIEPIYHQLFVILKDSIDKEEIKSGDFLPSERNLCEMFDVSRITIRKALDELENISYVKRQHGKRTKVMSKFDPIAWTELNDFSRDMILRGRNLKSIVIRSMFIKAPEKVQKILKLNEGEDVFLLERVRVVNNVKISFNISYLRDTSKTIYSEDYFDEDASIKKAWIAHGIEAEYVDETVEAKVPSERITELLDMDGETAILKRERITYDKNMRPIEFVTQSYNANYSKYYIEKGPVK